MPFFFRKTLIVVRRALLGRQSSALTGSCKQMGHAWGSEDWPARVRGDWARCDRRQYLQSSHMAWSQHGVRNALFASLLQAAQRSFTGISSIVSDLKSCQLRPNCVMWPRTNAAISAGVAAIASTVECALEVGRNYRNGRSAYIVHTTWKE